MASDVGTYIYLHQSIINIKTKIDIFMLYGIM